MENGYYTIDTADPNFDSILKWLRDEYETRGGHFWPIFNADRSQTLVQVKRDFSVNADLGRMLRLSDDRIRQETRRQEWTTAELPDETVIRDYLEDRITAQTLLTTLRTRSQQPAGDRIR